MCLRQVCDALQQHEGEDLLRFLRAVYNGEAEPARTWPGHVVDMAATLGLLESDHGSPSLTASGYLVGNVAKEYCNWLDAGRHMPPPRPTDALLAGREVLDLGCSFGRWMWEFQPIARHVTGLELQPEYIELGRALARRESLPPPEIQRGAAEEVDRHVPPCSADVVFARLLFNYVAIPRTLRKVARVLRPGGVLWIQVESLAAAVRKIVHGEHRWRSRASAAFAVANSILLSTSGLQLGLRAPGRMHQVHHLAYPTVDWWQAALRAAGYRDIRVETNHAGNLVFIARIASHR